MHFIGYNNNRSHFNLFVGQRDNKYYDLNGLEVMETYIMRLELIKPLPRKRVIYQIY